MIETETAAVARPIRAGNNARTDSADALIFPPLLLIGTFLLALIPRSFWPLPFVEAPWARVFGGVVFVAGTFLAAWTAWQMKRAGTNLSPREPALVLVKVGLFRFTRNPLYVLNLFNYLGLALAINSLWPVLFFAPMVAVLYWGIILREERYLAAKFGRDYLDYQRRVPRWLWSVTPFAGSNLPNSRRTAALAPASRRS